MSNILNLKTGEPFDPLPRLHHREESPLQVSSSEHSSRARGMLLAAKSFYIGGRSKIPYLTDGLIAAYNAYDGADPLKDAVGNMGDIEYVSGNYTLSNGILGGVGGAVFRINSISAFNSAFEDAIWRESPMHVEMLSDFRSSPFMTTQGRNDGMNMFSAYGAEGNTTYPKIRIAPCVINVGYVINRRRSSIVGSGTAQADYSKYVVPMESSQVLTKKLSHYVVYGDYAKEDGSTMSDSLYNRLSGDLKPRFIDGGFIKIEIAEGMTLRCLRVYANAHTQANLFNNYSVEKARFNLP